MAGGFLRNKPIADPGFQIGDHLLPIIDAAATPYRSVEVSCSGMTVRNRIPKRRSGIWNRQSELGSFLSDPVSSGKVPRNGMAVRLGSTAHCPWLPGPLEFSKSAGLEWATGNHRFPTTEKSSKVRGILDPATS
jgi:hypothetical protein